MRKHRTTDAEERSAQVFDGSGYLKPQMYRRLKVRVRELGAGDFNCGCAILAEHLHYGNGSEIASVLMWNERASRDLSVRLVQWIVAGMPDFDRLAGGRHGIVKRASGYPFD